MYTHLRNYGDWRSPSQLKPQQKKDISSLGANAINIPVKLVIWPLGFKEIPGALDGSWDSNWFNQSEHSVCGAYADHVLIIRWSFADHVLHKPHPKPERWRASRSAAHWSNYTMEWILLNQRWKGWKRLKGGYFCGPKWWPPSLGTKSKSLQKIPCFIIFFGDRCFTMPQHATTFVALNDLHRRAIATWFRQQTDTCTLSSTFKNWAFRMQRNVGLSQMITRYHK